MSICMASVGEGPKMREMQIWMFKKILRFELFRPPTNEKYTDLDVTDNFKIFNILDPPNMRKM